MFNIRKKDTNEKFTYKSPPTYPKDISWDMPLDSKPLLEQIRNSVHRHDNHACVEYMGKEYSYRYIWTKALKLASALKAMGIQSGDRIFVVLPNIPEAVISVIAVFLSGGIVVMANPLSSEEEHRFQVRDSGAKIAIVLDMLVDRFSGLYKEHPTQSALDVDINSMTLDYVITCSVADHIPLLKATLARLLKKVPYRSVSGIKGVIRFSEVIQVSDQYYGIMTAEDDTAAVYIYTGGTTGVSKAVELTYKNLQANIQQITQWMNFLEDGNTNVLGVFPLFSAAGFTALFLHAFVRGGTLSLIPRPNADSILAALKRREIHVFPGVPTIYKGLLGNRRFTENAGRYLSSVRMYLSGAAPLSNDLNARWKDIFGQQIHELYGMTETSAMAYGNRPDSEIKPGSVGLPLPHTQCKITDLQNGKVVENGTVGEICLQGPQVFNRYHNRPDETERTIKNGWLYTGDIGYLDNDGYLFIVGRWKEMIISSGYNVYPVEIENTIGEIKGVKECACMGVYDEYRGESIKAFVVLEPCSELTAEKIRNYCSTRIAKYKVPRDVEFLDELPKNSLGKIQKNTLVSKVI